jgi:hypothetical protein
MTRAFIGLPCADCSIGTYTIGEYYMVKKHVWEQAWAGRRKPWHGKIDGQEILCIGCLEKRIGRKLTACDFIDAPVNHIDNWRKSDRLRNRLASNKGTVKGADGLIAMLAEGMICKLPEHEQEAARQSFRNNVMNEDGAAP